MRSRIKQTALLLVCLFCFSLPLSGQETSKLTLSKVLSTLQEQYNVQFNYAQKTVEGIFIDLPEQTLSLAEVLHYLNTKTNLIFTEVSNSIILIKPNTNSIFCGYLKDEQGIKSLVSAHIYTPASQTTTDENGYFQIELNSPADIVTLSHLGYKTIRKRADALILKSCDTIKMQASFEMLSEVLISNYITSGINKVDNGTYEIDFSNFDILPGLIENDVLLSVQAFPGILSVNETVSNINIRGGSHDQNLILWDGIKMYQSGHFFGLISMYNPHITQKVSLIKNGSNVTLSDGVSGTISMKTDADVNEKFSGIIGANLTNINGFVDVPIGKKSSLQVAARKSINDIIETPTYTAFFDRIAQNTEVAVNSATITNTDESFDFYDTSLRWLYNLSDKDQLRVNFINVYNELLFNENASFNDIAQSRESSLTQSSIGAALNYDRVWNSALQTSFEVYETRYKLKSINANILDQQRFLQENSVSETSVKLSAQYGLNRNLKLIGGYHFVETGITNLDDVDNPIFRLLITEVLRTHAGFSQLNYRSSNNKTSLNVGLRYNYLDKFKKAILEPRLSFNQRFLNHFTVEVLGEFKHQTTSQVINFQNDFLGVEKRRWQLSNNEDIPVLTSKQASLGLSYNKKGWLLSLEGYYKTVDGITSQSQGFQNQYEFIKSVGNYTVNGLDVLVRKQFRNLNTWLSYSYMDNLYEFIDLEPNPFPSNYDISHSATLGLTYTLTNLKFSLGANWHSGRPITIPVSGNEIIDDRVNFDVTNASNIDDYLRVDVSALYNFKMGKSTTGEFGVSIWNLLNKENEINRFYRSANETLNETIQRSLALTPNVVFNLRF